MNETTGRRMVKAALAGVAVAGIALGGASAAVASATGDDGNEVPITGDALVRASAVALEFTGGGEVTETEQGDEDSFYEVEITLDDGNQIDVQLDEDFNVVGSEADGTTDADADFDGNGVVNVIDLGILRTLFFGTPGPSGQGGICDVQ